MKKLKYLLLFFGLVLSSSVRGQNGFYLGLNAGYGFSIGGTTSYDYTYGNNSVSYKSNPSNFGQGFTPNFQVGYFLHPNIGVELGIGYLFGSPYRSVISNGSYTSTLTYKMSSLYLTPSVHLRVPLGIFNPYLKTGVFIGVANLLDGTNYSNSPASNSYTYKYYGGVVFGLNASLGLEVIVQNRIGIYGELFVRYANYSPGSYIQTYTNSSSSTISTTSGDFKDNVTINYSTSSSSSASSTNITQDRALVSFTTNAIGFSVGIRYYLSSIGK